MKVELGKTEKTARCARLDWPVAQHQNGMLSGNHSNRKTVERRGEK